MELILDIDVKISGSYEVTGRSRVAVVPFTGTAAGKYCTGTVLDGAADTQKTKGGVCRMSARYMLEGTDYTGEKCRIFIENNGTDEEGFVPAVVTDSKALSGWETAELSAGIFPTEGGVNVKIYIL